MEEEEDGDGSGRMQLDGQELAQDSDDDGLGLGLGLGLQDGDQQEQQEEEEDPFEDYGAGSEGGSDFTSRPHAMLPSSHLLSLSVSLSVCVSDDDGSWKVRKAAAKVLSAAVALSAGSSLLAEQQQALWTLLFEPRCLHDLILRCSREREENVRLVREPARPCCGLTLGVLAR